MSTDSDRISAELLELGQHQPSSDVPTVPEAQLWTHKRAQQQRDIASIAAGRSTNEAMSWFSGGLARQAKAVNSPL
jgi:hypothetical protein